MFTKKGFLLVELMIGLTIFLFLISIITHYIIEVKNTQQRAIDLIEDLSLTRNAFEKERAVKGALFL